MSEPLISIIIPVYNVEKYLPKCLDSVINQTYQNLEIICINDSSPDNSLSILEEYAEKDKRIKIITKDNTGVSNARNSGLDIASGEYIMFIDADDWVSINICEAMYNIAKEKNIDVVMCDYIKEFSNVSKQNYTFDKNICFNKDDVKHKLYRRMIGLYNDELAHPEKADNLCTIWAKLYKRSIIEDNDIRFYDIRKIGTYEDGLFNLDVFRCTNTVFYVAEGMYHYRKDNKDSITTKYNKDIEKQHEVIHRYMIEYIEKYNLDNEFKIALQNRLALELLGYGLNIVNSKEIGYSKIKNIKKIINSAKYKQAYKQLEIKYMPIHWKVFYNCAKFNFASGVYVLLICIKRMIGK